MSTKAAASSGFQLTIANDNLVQKGATVRLRTLLDAGVPSAKPKTTVPTSQRPRDAGACFHRDGFREVSACLFTMYIMPQRARQVKFLTEKECALGVAFYPDVAYNGEGGYAQGAHPGPHSCPGSPSPGPRIDICPTPRASLPARLYACLDGPPCSELPLCVVEASTPDRSQALCHSLSWIYLC